MNKAILKFCNNPIFYQIIKNNGTIYGTIIRKNIVENIPLEELFDGNFIISCFGKKTFKDIIERDLNKWTKKKISLDLSSARSEICTYHLEYYDKLLIIDFCYIKSDLSFHLNNYQKELNLLLDIDTLYIDRYNFGMLEINNVHSREPIPLNKVLNNIKKRHFNILDNAKLLRKALVEYVMELKNYGWKNSDNYLLKISDLDDETLLDDILKQKCDICKCLNDENTVILPCQHYFHENCILDYLKNYVKDCSRDDVFKCPYCTKELNIIEIL
mgnify:CR=1 FL=1